MKSRLEGIVTEVSGTVAKVLLSSHGSCDSCGRCSGKAASIIQAKNEIGAKQGQSVFVEIEEKNTIKSTFIIFILPVLAGIAGYIVGSKLSEHFRRMYVLLPTIGVLVFLTGSIFYIRRYIRSLRSSQILPTIIQINR